MWRWVCVAGLGMMLGIGVARGEAAATTRAAEEGAMGKALEKLSADNFAQREQGVEILQEILAGQLRQQERVQEVLDQMTKAMAAQMKQMGTIQDPEARARVARLLQWNQGMSLFTADVLKAPADERAGLLEWGMDKKNAPVVAELYSRDRKVRLGAVKELAKMDGAGADYLLGELIEDHDAAIRAQAMAGAWERKASERVLLALWREATAGGEEIEQADESNQLKVTFPERAEPMVFGESGGDELPEGELATAVLLHYKDARTTTRLKELVGVHFKQGRLVRWPGNDLWQRNVLALWAGHEVKEAVPLLVAVHGPAGRSEGGGIRVKWASME